MPLGLAFWIIMLVCLVFWTWQSWGNHLYLGGGFVIFILLAIIGWKVFGPPLQG
jgi:hypothetical protein